MSEDLGAPSCTVVGGNAALQDATLEAIARVKGDDPLAPVTLLVPSRSLAWQLRRQLAWRMPAGTALVNVRALTDVELMDECAVALGLTPASGGDRIMRAAILENALRRAGGVLGVSADHPETAVRLGRVMDDLKWCALDDASLEQLPEHASPTSAAAIRFVQDVRTEVSEATGATDVVTLSEEIVSRIRELTSVPRGIAAFGTIVVVSQAIPAPVWSVLTGVGVPVHRVRIDSSVAAINAQIHGVPDPATEVALAVRYAAEAIDSGVDPQRVAIIYSTSIPYAGLLDHALADAEIAWHGPTPRSLRETVLARRIDTLLEMAEEWAKGAAISRPTFMRWLALEPARVNADDPRSAVLRDLIRSEGLFGNARNWSTALGELQSLSEAAHVDEDSDSRARRRHWSASNAGYLNELITELTTHLQSIAESRTWRDIAAALQAATDRYSPETATPRSAAESSARALLTELLGSSLPWIDSMMNAQASRHLRPAPDTLRALIDREFDRMRASHGDAAVGVNVGTFASTRCLMFDTVIVVGAADGLLPSVRNSNPLINDATRELLRSDPADAPTVAELEEQTRRDVVSAVTSANSVIVTFPRGAIPGSGVSQVSRYFHTEMPDDRTSFRSYRHALGEGPRPVAAIDIAVAGHGDECDSQLQGKVDSLRAWARPQFDEHFGSVAGTDRHWDISARPLSASAIESYLHCPYGFFVDRILGFSTDSFDDEVEEISAKDVGLLLHSALEEFVTAAGNEGWLPAPGEPWPNHAADLATSIFIAKAQQAEAKGLTGWEPAWNAQRDLIVDAIPQFLDIDSTIRTEPPMSPGEAELGFGFDDQPSASVVTSRGTAVDLRGAIDRLDVSPDGRSARVIDYKTGKAANFTKALGNREKIQDLVYSAAVRSLRPGVDEALVTFLFVPNGGDVTSVDPTSDVDPVDALVEILDRVEESAIAGSFPPSYQGSRDYCPVCSLLGRRARRIHDHHAGLTATEETDGGAIDG
jgi:RecB family exonuclease